MLIYFLSAADGTQLTKRYREIAPGQYEVESYPHVARFNSHAREIETLTEFKTHLEAHAAEGLCLLKGRLNRTLTNESRAGSTDAHEVTQWLCLDVDAELRDFVTPADFVDSLGREFEDVSFIFHYSASSGIKSTHWRGHVFVLLSEAVSPQAIKQWLIARNFDPGLSSSLGLAASGGTLRYPLDVSTCQNDKLLFIAPPVCENFGDPIDERFVLVERSKEAVDFSPNVSAAKNQAMIADKIVKLRDDTGLPKKTFRIAAHPSGFELMRNPDPVTVTGKREARGFCYLNLNNGDSWAYYYPLERPEFLFNFKGEPVLRLQDVDPSLAISHSPTTATKSADSDFRPLVLRDPVRDIYYNGKHYTQSDTVEIHPTSNKTKLEDFLGQYGHDMPEHVPDWTLVFDPTTFCAIDYPKQWINLFKPTAYMRDAASYEAHETPVVDRVITHICVDEDTREHFINWLAFIFQTRQRTNTAWIFQGVQGTGKGLLFNKIIRPLIGDNYCNETTIDSFDDQFNAHLEKTVVLFIDEANVADSRKGDRTINKLKNLITEPELSIRAMRTNRFVAANFNNLIFASNQVDMVPIDASDRRFNVAPRQETALIISEEEIEQIEEELESFAGFLSDYAVDRERVRRVLLGQARESLIDMSETSLDKFFRCFNEGNLEYFTQFLSSSPPPDEAGLLYPAYAHIIRDWIASSGTPINIAREDLHTVYKYIQGAAHQTAAKFSRLCSRYAVRMEPIRFATQMQRGVAQHTWQLDPELRELLTTTQENTENVRHIR